ncbi:MAG: hypothetical protein J1F16_05000 [Muribaculaceae bacterium]|nr:hypothetical protein [Muribaculaceae bacterium]
MKQKLIYLLFIIPMLQGCVENEQTGEMTPGWLFWVFLGLLLGGLFFGAFFKFLRKNKPDDLPTKSEQEIEAYEETLRNKLKKNSDEDNKK